MKLTDLEPHFVRYESRIETYSVIDGDEATWRARGCPTREIAGPRQHIITVDSFEQAQGLWLLCPKCFTENGGRVGTHLCDVTFANRGVLDEHGAHGSEGKPTRWEVQGTGLADLTIRPSILIVGGCGWHGFITSGEVDGC